MLCLNFLKLMTPLSPFKIFLLIFLRYVTQLQGYSIFCPFLLQIFCHNSVSLTFCASGVHETSNGNRLTIFTLSFIGGP